MQQLDDTIEKLKQIQGDFKANLDSAQQSLSSQLSSIKVTSAKMTEGFDPSNEINTFLKKMTNIGKGLEKIFKGLFIDEMQGLGKGLSLGFNHIGEFMFWTSEFFFTYILCGIQYIQNLHKCILYYSLDIAAKAFYSPISIFLWFAYEVGGQDLYGLENEVWNVIYYIDKTFFDLFGFHFAHYPKAIVDTCYNCKRLKILALKSKASQINYDFEKKMPELLQAGLQEMYDGANIMGQ
jgi:hypothetical protein